MATAHISDMGAAIAAGDVPGAFEEGRAVFVFPTLTYAGSRGAAHNWTVRVRLLRGEEYVPITAAMLHQPVPALAGYRAEITVEAGQEGGKVRDVVPTYVSAGKNSGKRNATNPITQALRDALGLYNKHRRRGDIIKAAPTPLLERAAAEAKAEAAAAGPERAVDEGPAPAGPEPAGDPADDMPPPQLVKKLGDSGDATLTPPSFQRGITAQPKLNGVRLVAFNAAAPADGGDAVMIYSRTGVRYPGQAHIVAELRHLFFTAPPVPEVVPAPAGADPAAYAAAYAGGPGGLHLDGELYLHGHSLPWISGQARKGDDEGRLEYHVFDVFFPRAKARGLEMASRDRQAYLSAVFAAAASVPYALPHLRRVENTPVVSAAELERVAKRYLREGYEGAIARKDWAGYQYGYSNYHSANLVKIKPKFDDEFPVVGYTQGTRGKDVGAVIWECEVPNPVIAADARFTVVPNMTYEDRRRVYRCLGETVAGRDGRPTTRFERDVRGRPLTVEYAERSAKTGKPLQPKAVAFRTYEEGTDADPIARMLRECR